MLIRFKAYKMSTQMAGYMFDNITSNVTLIINWTY